MRITAQSSIALMFAANLVFASGAPIGVVRSGGDFRLDDVSVRSNATILDGSTVEAGLSRSELNLNNGTRVTLPATSRGKVYTDRVVLEKGSTEVAGSDRYRVEARSLKITPDSMDSVAQITLGKSNLVVVAAKSGAVRVMNSSGVLVARVFPGAALELDPNAAAPSMTKISGVLHKKGAKFLLRDATTKIVFDVRGSELATYDGKTVVVTGTPAAGATPAAEASQVLNATQVAAGAAGATGAGAVAAGKVAGMSTRAFTAVVGGVAAASTVAGLAASGVLSGSDQPISRP